MKLSWLCLFTRCIFLQNCTQFAKAPKREPLSRFYAEEDFKKEDKYDTHVHISVDDTTFIQQAREDKLRLLTVNVYSGPASNIEEKQEVALRLIKAYPDECFTF
jgi:hypothetical protein